MNRSRSSSGYSGEMRSATSSMVTTCSSSLALIAYASACWLHRPGEILFALPLGAGIAVAGFSWRDLRYFARPRTDPLTWRHDHAEFMLRAGIAYHTAFGVFVLTPWLGQLGNGALAVLPWVLP